jgi:hypothetical protein
VNWDRNGSLMGSFVVPSGFDGVWLNVYPGIVDLGPVDVGLYADVHRDRMDSVGLTLSYAPVVPGVRF